jgi:ATP-dependent exoDNAse (exonuclease V) beta subunit
VIELGDAEARRAIREDLGETLVVEAAAGTGKTTEMIARIIAVLRTGATTLERLVAVTFTEKAAGEMKLRLRTELEKARIAAGGEARDRLEAALGELEVARIGSIHSFCADLLRERPIEAGVDPLFEVAAEDVAEQLFARAFDAWFQAALADPPEGVRRILRRDDPAELLRRAGWSLVDRRDFDGAWRRDAFARDAALDAVVAELRPLAAVADRAYRADDYLAKLLGKLGRWLAELDRREAVRARDHDGLEAELAAVERWKEWRNTGKGQNFGDGLSRADVILQRDAAKSELGKFRDAAEADLAACLREELRPLVAGYEQLKAKAGKLDFLDLLVRTRDLLRDDPRVRAELSARFTHFFIDEFQDTDPLQVEILVMLCGQPIAPGKLFVVGDPKQAIYRFRRADIALYESVVDRLLAGGAKLLHLTTSFRATGSIQAAINGAFAPVMTGGGQARYVALEHHRDDIGGQPAIVALPVPKPYGWRDVANWMIEDSYPDAVGAFVDYLIGKSGWRISERGRGDVPVRARHVCLMFRRFQSFGKDLTRPYVRALEARGIPHVLVGGRSFHEREETESLRNALRAIEWPDDELSVYATLRGPLFAFHDEDLIAFKHVHGRLSPIAWSSRDGNEIAGALQLLAQLHTKRNRRAIADTLMRVLAATRAHAGIAVWPAGEQALANISRVLDLARRFESAGASSFRAFVERLEDDAERGRQADAPVVEEGTEGVRIMTAHAAKGLEFPVVILCDPTAPLAQERPSRVIDSERRVWLEPLAGCVPSELRERAEAVVQRDREEGQRLAYVAATRARDLLVVPVVGDEERPSWLEALAPVIRPDAKHKRSPARAPNCPPFGDDSVVSRGKDSQRMPYDSVAPGLHVPRIGAHRVVWWDPNVLALDKDLGGGVRHQQILAADDGNAVASASEAAHDRWQARRASALAIGGSPSLVVRKVTDAARAISSGDAIVAIESTPIERHARPHGARFGSLVHAILAAVDLHAPEVRAIAANHARLVAASADELAAAIAAAEAAIAHPLLRRAAAAAELRREVPVALVTPADGMIEGIVDLAFAEGGAWTVVDYKTDVELGDERAAYEAQVRLYARAIAAATGMPATPILLLV